MKQMLIIGAFIGSGVLSTHAQTIAVMAEQLAALQAFQKTMEQGYHLMSTGLQTIGQITEGEFQLHQTYFGSLTTVDAAVGTDPRLSALQKLQAELLQQVNAALDYWRRQRSLQP